jgi:addiction module RelB/DinJ family antitoxin
LQGVARWSFVFCFSFDFYCFVITMKVYFITFSGMQTIMARSTYYQLRLSEEEKTSAFSVFQELGLTPAQAFRLFLRQVVKTRSIPFQIREVQAPVFDEQAEKERLIQRMEARRGYKLPRFSSREEALASADRAYQEAKNTPQPVDDMDEEELMKVVDEAREEIWQEQQKEKLLAFASN